MQSADVERIAKTALRELGAGNVSVTVTPGPHPDRWLIAIGGSERTTMSIRAGAGTSPNFIREQIFEQYHR